jgi:hypothetical protein
MEESIRSIIWDTEKPRKTSSRTASFRPEISTRDLPNTKQNCYTLDREVLSIKIEKISFENV